MEPKISVIIPTYNRAAVLPRAINSVLAQSATPRWTDPSFGGKDAEFEIIVVDDGSTDDTKSLYGVRRTAYDENSTPCNQSSVLRSPSAVRVRFLSQSNGGPSAARNLGIRHAKGEWIAFLDSDDEWLPGKLKAQMKFFGENPDCLICQTEEIWIRNGKRVNPMKKHQKSGGFIFEKCLPLCVVSPSAVMMHRKLFDEVGLFDESLPACEDYDLWLRIACRYPIGLIEKPHILKYGGHADQRSREFPAMDRFRIQSLAKILSQNILTPGQAVAAQSMLEEKARIYIEGAMKRGKEKEAAVIHKLIGWNAGSGKNC